MVAIFLKIEYHLLLMVFFLYIYWVGRLFFGERESLITLPRPLIGPILGFFFVLFCLPCSILKATMHGVRTMSSFRSKDHREEYYNATKC
jgi:hypothetical protein